MKPPKSRRGVVKRFNEAPSQIRDYFRYLPRLAEEFPWEISLAYLFWRLELAHKMAIYCGVVKLHRAHTEPAWEVVNRQHMTRGEFRELFNRVFGKSLKSSVYSRLEEAQQIRDKIMHGKIVTDAQQRKAVVDVITYAEQFNNLVFHVAKFRPFGKLQGYKGRKRPLEKETTRWLLKGMGFSIS